MNLVEILVAVCFVFAPFGSAFPRPAPVPVITGIVIEDVVLWIDGSGHTISETTVLSTTFKHASKTVHHGTQSSSTFVPVRQSQASVSEISSSTLSGSSVLHASSTSISTLSSLILTIKASAITTSAAASASVVVSSGVTLPSISNTDSGSLTRSQPAATSTIPSTSSSFGFGTAIAYSPYTSGGDCKSASQVAQDLAQLSEFSVVRLYGTDCNQIANALAAVKTQKSQQIFAGIFDVSQASAEAQSLIAQVSGAWDRINTVSVGNEAITNGMISVSALTEAVGSVRGLLRSAGFQGPVVTVDTMVAMQANPQLCQVSDYCAINCHAYFDGGVTAAQAGQFVQHWIGLVRQAVGPGKEIIVTESGWPSQGGTNGKAVPSLQNQQAAVTSLKAAFSKNLVLYAAYNNYWQADSSSTFGTEHYWGILGNAPCGA